MFKHVFHIDPVAKGRPRIGKGFAYTPAKTRKFESAIKLLAKRAIVGDPISGPLAVSVTFNIAKPKSSKNILPIVKPDLDNFLKGLLDSLNGIFYKDDAQIVELYSNKTYASSGSIEITIEKIGF